MKISKSLAFDHLYLSDIDRRLIVRACEGGETVFLARLDKGLSGSSLWQAKWRLQSGVDSKMHVFKIGIKMKLKREETAIRSIASVLDPRFSQVNLYEDEHSRFALLRQEFAGNPTGKVQSLRQFIETCRDSKAARDTILDLYLTRMRRWHSRKTEYPEKRLCYKDALDWWVKRADLHYATQQIGIAGLEQSLQKCFKMTLKGLQSMVKRTWNSRSSVSIGPVHGDLHAQNVIFDKAQRIELIDFGWTSQEKWKAIDFLMMECSLKFVASPPNASLPDLLRMEQMLDSKRFGSEDGDYAALASVMHGSELVVIARAIHAVRHCAFALNAVKNAEQYHAGLVTLMSGLTSLPSLINRIFLIHSIAYHLLKLSSGD